MLNPSAPEFIPAWATCYDPSAYTGYYDEEGPLSEEELLELEAMEDWVNTMAELEAAEQEHIIATALSEAEPSQILEVEMRALATEGGAAPARPAARKHHGRRGQHQH
ncbi:hypothetical protein HYH03_003201 [Edaphochlamys debaryana]|uniref:Uncharacterized protein n=1 Tax=Edaphochlamys debaryana TaxID=47281 RepID=A0A836C3P1_9CHLO|nr:hypothetical protein HYH03_003201 [Edaphochlamys debaryana]|eukprot:KAG2499015.1 hypothetical protein HYH03_003201 [Edaphochlamys debaryana]